MYLIGIIIFIILIALIIWGLSSSNSHKKNKKHKRDETHIHPKPHFDQKKNRLIFRGSPHAQIYTAFKRVFVTEENKKDLWNITKSETTGTEIRRPHSPLFRWRDRRTRNGSPEAVARRKR